ncbi:MAG: hypothetical protein K6C12_12095 [Oscillospiraceae bacterium]|nr:hypothetical protein [Oscillospiraceae bacterium]
MIYLIDFENVHEDGFTAIGRLGDKDAVYCFFTKNVAKISMSALAGIKSGQLHFVEADTGKQSLDLALVSFLGYLIGTRPQELCYEIISNDNGFQKAVDFWNKRGMNLRVRVRKTNVPEPKQKAETKQEVKPKAEAKLKTEGKQKSDPVRIQTAAVSQSPSRTEKTLEKQSPVKEENRAPNKTASAADGTVPASAASALDAASKPENKTEGKTDLKPDSRTESGTAAEREPGTAKAAEQGSAAESKPAGTSRNRTRKKSTASKKPAEQLKPAEPPKETEQAAPEKPVKEETSTKKKAESTLEVSEMNAAEADAGALQHSGPGNSSSAQRNENASSVENRASENAVSENPALSAALEAAGITGERSEFLQTQLQKYRNEKNVKQLIYLALVKKYGQKSGTEIYNTAKKIQL